MDSVPKSPKRLYRWNRNLHLYLGVALSPLLLLFAVTAILLNHGVTPSPVIMETRTPIVWNESLSGEAWVRDILDQLNLSGEVVGRGQIRNGRTVIRVARPGNAKIITLTVGQDEAVISDRSFDLMDTMRYLHLNPGPHKSPSWIGSIVWGWVADATVYITLLLTVTGIYLWLVLKAERKAGLLALGTGAVAFAGILYSLIGL